MYGHHGGRLGPIKSYSVTAQDIVSLDNKYKVPKDFVNRRPLTNKMEKRIQKSEKNNNYSGVHMETLERNPLDVVYSDPKDSKLYQVPGAEPRPESEDMLYKVYVSGREAQYCRPYITMKHPPTQTTVPTGM